jgi:hypothetical protein
MGVKMCVKYPGGPTRNKGTDMCLHTARYMIPIVNLIF